ncbi:MFS transporter, UMF1 family [Mariprofundus micogutta]|uniref:MFS transporter, UMF1 family n=1 Tax=Mariprofundus micogutta TaxID=1921010 RepID=A0A1L8CKB3_9PROT|nr:MFS transporter [Mariprofundus micogutta]GAV19340.1 MFS transporter, UMF1 family [Mariprofundus micogutta]
MADTNRKTIYAWALYDWANSAYTTTVMAGFFPVFFKQYWANDLTANESTFWLGVANAVAGLVIALVAPVLGAMADQGGLKKQMMLSFTSLAVVMTAALFLVNEGQWLMAVLVYLFGAIAFSGANVFYDALIVDVAEQHELDRVSALGYALGYIGGGILFAVNVVMTLHPDWFLLADKVEAVRWSFLTVAIWWALFTIPVALFVQEAGETGRKGLLASAKAGFHQLGDTLHHLRSLRQVWLFLIAYFLYIDGVNTVAHMAVDYGLSLEFNSDVLIAALLMTQFIAFPAALAAGWLGGKFGAKRVIIVSICIYALACIWSSTMQNENDFYWLAAAIGLVMGGIQALSRSMYARLIPKGQAAEFFGFFNMLGKFATVFGPLLMGVASVLSGSARFSILVIVVLFAAGAIVLYYVDEKGQKPEV